MSPPSPPSSGLLGRRRECEALDQLVAGVLAGQSRVLVLRGEAGVGKTALLVHLAANAMGCRIARAAGVESEMELPFAGLHALCAPLLGELERIPRPQRDALRTAFGLAAGAPPDRFLVGLAVLSLLADAAEQRPLMCIVDDAQWLDQISAQTLSFVARRLLAERVGMVFALREPADTQTYAGLPGLAVDGLDDAEARALLDSTLPGPLDELVRRRIIAEAAGNPLALLELPRGLTPATVAGGFGLPGAISSATRIEHSFAQQLEPLSPDTRRLLLLAAAEPVGDVTLLWRAAALLGVSPDAAPAQAAGLLEIGAQVRFRHPLVRRAAYRVATVPDRRQVHQALAEATDPQLDPDRRAWHRARAAERPDESVADELERSADRARARGGVAAAAAFLERAAALSPDPARRGRRALVAAQAKFQAGASDAALELLAAAEACPLDELQRARLIRLRGQIAFALTRGGDAPPLMLRAAQAFEALDVAQARETYLEALGAAIFIGRRYADGVRKVAEAARAAPALAEPRSIDRVLDGMATRYLEGPGAGAALLRLALETFRSEPLERHDETLRWLQLCPTVLTMTVFELWDDEAFHALAARAVRLARDLGVFTMLPVTLPYLSGVHVFEGDFAAAAALNEEADGIAAATGNVSLPHTHMVLAAWRGVERDARELITRAVDLATARGETGARPGRLRHRGALQRLGPLRGGG